MLTPGCLWNRRRLGRLVDGALGPRAGRAAAAHVAGCADCRREVERLRRLRGLVRGAQVEVPDPDWTGFWPAVRTRIARETTAPVRDPWWLPFWKPVWGHPRMAFGSAAVSALAAALVLWPAPQAPKAVAATVQVEDVSTSDPNRSVMVYSSPEDDVTVIWVFNPAEQDEQS